MSSSIKMDELLVKWLGSDAVFENVEKIVQTFQTDAVLSSTARQDDTEEAASTDSPRGVIPPFYPKRERRQRWQKQSHLTEENLCWLSSPENTDVVCLRDQVMAIFKELADVNGNLTMENFGRITKEVCRFPSFFNGPLYARIMREWNMAKKQTKDTMTQPMLEWYWMQEMENYDSPERFFRLIKQPDHDYIGRDDFLPYIKELLNDHPVRPF